MTDDGTVAIEKNVPLPRGSGRAKYPFAEMAVGDSIVVEAKGLSAAHHYGRRNGVRFTVRRLGDGTVRVWRTA